MLIYIKKYQIIASFVFTRLFGITFAKTLLSGVGKWDWQCALHSARALRSIRLPFDVAIHVGVGFCEFDGFLRNNNRGAAPLCCISWLGRHSVFSRDRLNGEVV